mgnify:CR=1 FL=1
MENKFLEQLISKGLLSDVNYVANVTSNFQTEYFEFEETKYLFNFIKNYFWEYNGIPPKDIILGEIDEEGFKEKVNRFLNEIDNVDFEISSNYDYLFEKTNEYLKENALKRAVWNTIEIIKNGEDTNQIRSWFEDALSKDLKIDLGLNYFEDLRERLTKILEHSTTRIPTYYPILDERINGGFPPYTLSLFLGRIHGFKSTTLANIAARQVQNGHNVVLFTLEMSEDEFAQRFDSILSGLDINKIYTQTNYTKELIEKLQEIKNDDSRGNLFIKQFPTGAASIKDFRVFLRELKIRGYPVDICYCDYLNLMQPEGKARGELYQDGKKISEELRALGLEFNCPIVSVSQLNRTGTFVDFDELDFNYIGECLDPYTELIKWNGQKIYLKDIQIGEYIKGSKGDVEVKDKFSKKKKKYKIITESGKEIICSKDHKFPVNEKSYSIDTGLSINYYVTTLSGKEKIIDIYSLNLEEDMIDIEVSDDHLFYANNILTNNSLGISATCDFMSILGIKRDLLVYNSELHGKIVKNRLGGRVGEIYKWYFDSRSLKIYDGEAELDKWIQDAAISKDKRELADNSEE